jgi:hypothetical protein
MVQIKEFDVMVKNLNLQNEGEKLSPHICNFNFYLGSLL